MNYLKSTQKSIVSLAQEALKNTCKTKSQRGIQLKTSDLLYGQKYNKRNIKECYAILHFSIRFKSSQIGSRSRSLSTINLCDVPLLNPNKPSPEDGKVLVAQPIVPLTLPRFPKHDSEVPSVTKVLQATMPAASRFVLDRWRDGMIKKLGVSGFNQYQHETFERGRMLHALLAEYLLGRAEPNAGKAELTKEVVANLWKSIQNVVRDKITNVRLVEHIVTHSSMNYRGIVDCVAFYGDELVVIDFKTAEKPKNNIESLYDNPLQVSAYCGAINNDSSIPSHVIDRNISAGVVIIAYVDGSEASTYHLGCEQISNNYWKQWTTRLDQFSRKEEMMKPKLTKNITKQKNL